MSVIRFFECGISERGLEMLPLIYFAILLDTLQIIQLFQSIQCKIKLRNYLRSTKSLCQIDLALTKSTQYRVYLIHSVVGGVPRPSLSWKVKKHGDTVYTNLLASEVLDIENITIAQSGMYQCIVENPIGQSIKTTGNITIIMFFCLI